MTTQIVRRPWRQRITNDLDGGFGIQMFAHLAKNEAIHSNERAASAVEAAGTVGRGRSDLGSTATAGGGSPHKE